MTRKLAALFVVCFVLLTQRPQAQSSSAKIFLVDIGQGAATLIVSPTGKTLLVDGGPPGSSTKIGSLLTTLGIPTIDYTVLTHYHIDHDSGLTELMNAGKVAGTAYDVGDGGDVAPPSANSTQAAWVQYKAAASRPGITRQTVTPGTVIDLGGGMRATVVAAAGNVISGLNIPFSTSDLNSESVSVLVEYKDFDFIVSGDLTGGGATSTAKTPDVESFVGQAVGDVDVVQLSHHGSTTTSSQRYLSAVKAEVALVQSGFTNTFGHPNRETANKFLNTLTTFGARFTGTGVPAPGSGPVLYQHEESPDSDDRVTHQGHTGAVAANSGSGTILLETDGMATYSLKSFDDGGVRIASALHTYPVDGASLGVTTDFAPTVIASILPEVPLATDTVTVSARATDRESAIASVTLTYSIDGTPQAPLPMVLAGSLYQASIPPQPDGTRIDYAVSGTTGAQTTTFDGGYFAGVTPISSLRALNARGEPLYVGYAARIQATVTAGSGLFASGTNDDYVQDATGAINVFRVTQTVTPFTSTVAGQAVQIKGLVGFLGGRVRLDVTQSLEKTASPFGITATPGTAVDPLIVSIAELNAGPEAYEGRLVSIPNASLVGGSFPVTAQSLDSFVTVSDGSGSFSLKIDKDTDVDGFNPGATFPLTGIVQQDDFLRPFDSGYNVAPRSRADLGGTPASAVLMPIADAKVDEIDNDSGAPGADFVPDLVGQFVRVRGTVTSIDFQGSASTEYYIQDATGGVDVFASGIGLGPFAIGNSIEVVGLVTHFNGLTELTVNDPSNAVLLPAGTTPAVSPQLVTIGQLTNPATAEALEGKLVRLDNVTVTTATIPGVTSSPTFPGSGASGNVVITDGSAALMVLRVDSDTNIDGTPTPSGPFSVTALASQFGSSPFDGGYQILPRSTSDIVAATPALSASPTTAAFGSVALGAAASSTITLTNTGAAMITLTPPFVITGADASQFSVGAPGTTTLAVGASTTVSVSFAPTITGPRSASLNITSATSAATVALTGTGSGGVNTALVISEFRFRGPSGGNDEFVELYNNTDGDINIGGYKLKGSNNAGTNSTRATVPASVTLGARRHYLFTNSGAAGYSGSVPGNTTYTTGVTDDGGIAITRPDDSIVDQVGLSAGSAFKEGTTLASLGASNLNRGYERKQGGAQGSQVDSDTNSQDFLLRTPSDPQNMASAPTPAIMTCPAISVTGSLPGGNASVPYSATLTASGGTPPYTFGLASGTLPAGLTLGANGTLDGTPTAAGAFAFSVQAVDAIGCSGAAPYSVTIAGTATLTAAASFDFGSVGVNGSHLQFVTVTNASSFAVTLTPPFAVTGANAAEFVAGSSTATLNSGASASVPVTFQPAVTGSRTATVTFTSDSSGSATVTLQGTGTTTGTSASVVVSEFRVRGPAGGNDEFVELYNATPTAIDIGGYKLMGSNGSGLTTVRATVPAGRAIPAYGHYLFTNAASSGYSGTVSGDQTYTTGVTDDGGVAIAGPDGAIVDAAGLSAGSAFKEGTPLTSLGSTNADRAYERLVGGVDGSHVDTDRNASDFVLRTPSGPENTASASTPSIVVSPTSIDFGSVPAGIAASATVTVTNIGGSVVTLNPPATTGPDGGAFVPGVPSATTLAAGETADVAVGFNPLTLGSKSATLSVSTASGETRFVALLGTGICPVVTLSGPLPNGTVGAAYAGLLTGSGGIAPSSFSLAAGFLPGGLSLDAGGTISGTPSAAGLFSFDVQATDANGCAGTASFAVDIARAPVSLTWSTPASIVYGTLLDGTQLNASAPVGGVFEYTPASGAQLNAGAGQTLSVTFTPDDVANYEPATSSVTIDVTPAPLTVTAADASREFGAANPSFGGVLSGVIAGDGITASYASASDTSSAPGIYAIVPDLQDPGGRLFNYTVTITNGVLTVTDTTGPALSVPASVTAVATTASGAVVTYSASATDLVDGPVTITCSPASGSSFPIGTTTVTCSAVDAHANSSTATFDVTVTDPSEPGRMNGNGRVDVGTTRHDIDFHVRERSTGADSGELRYTVRTRVRGRDEEHRFRTTLVTNVFFTNAPGVSPGRRPPSGIDTVSFSGTGLWDGQGGYTFEAVAADAGEPGRGRDRIMLTIRNSAGVVAEIDATLTDGNFQSLRPR